MEDAWQSALDAKDPAAMAAMYTEDAVLLPANSESVSGRASIEAFWTEALDGGISGLAKDDEAYAHSDLGYTVGTYTLMDAGGTTIDEGKYIVIWRNVDGTWKMHRDIWNSSLPLPALD